MRYTAEQVMHAIHDEVDMLEKTDTCYDVSISEVVRRAMMKLQDRPQKPERVHEDSLLRFEK